MNEYHLALQKLYLEIAKLPLEDQTLWNESITNISGICESHPAILNAVTLALFAKAKTVKII